ncbi:1251_t:CDS:2, partial [Entrophospora sp. SA101]
CEALLCSSAVRPEFDLRHGPSSAAPESCLLRQEPSSVPRLVPVLRSEPRLESCLLRQEPSSVDLCGSGLRIIPGSVRSVSVSIVLLRTVSPLRHVVSSVRRRCGSSILAPRPDATLPCDLIGDCDLVIKRFLELAEEKVTTAQAKADQITLETVDDLEASETPESIMLSTVSGEQSKDRTDRAVVTPWLKFLWEAYRTALDFLRNNVRLEVFYQQTAHQAFQFCLKYTRKTEFRRLCELLRNHLQNIAKYPNQTNLINLNEPETLKRHLDTRFYQLNAAVELELWQEAFRSVEDIHNLLSLSKGSPKPMMMANYYDKLTKIFLVGENYLFHAAAWNCYYTLVKTQNKSLSDEENTRMASFVLLSVLAIPVITNSKTRLLEIDDNKNKQHRLAILLGMSRAPTRTGLLKEA